MERPPFGYEDEEWHEVDYSDFDFLVTVVPEYLLRPRPGRAAEQLAEELEAAKQVSLWKRRVDLRFADWAKANSIRLYEYHVGDKLVGEGSGRVREAEKGFRFAYDNWRDIHNAAARARVAYVEVPHNSALPGPTPF